MSPRQGHVESGNGLKAALGALVVVLIAVGMMFLLRARPGSEPFDPRSGSPDGTRGLVLLLERYGADVTVSRAIPDEDSGATVLVLVDVLDDTERQQLRDYANAGGVVVVADPASPFVDGVVTSPVPDGGGSGDTVGQQANIDRGVCDIGALGHLRGVFSPGGVMYSTAKAGSTCFGGPTRAFTLATGEGDGVIVTLGDNRIFTNRLLPYADNSGLATALLAPQPGGQVTIVRGAAAPKTVSDIGTGEKTLSDLISPSVWMAITMLAVSFVVLAFARAIRPGRPVREPEQVPIAGSELVAATGNLMQRARHAGRASWLLRGDTYRLLCRRLRLPANASIADVDAASAAQLGTRPGQVADLLNREPANDAELLALSAQLDQLRALAARRATVPAAPDAGDGAIPDHDPTGQGVPT